MHWLLFSFGSYMTLIFLSIWKEHGRLTKPLTKNQGTHNLSHALLREQVILTVAHRELASNWESVVGHRL